MCELSSLNQKISSISENLEKAVNDMKVQNRNASIFSVKTLRFYKMNYPKEMKSSNLLMKFSRQCLIYYQQEEMTKLSQTNSNNNDICKNNNNNNLSNCWNTINKRCINSTSSKYNKINVLKIYNYCNNNSNSTNKVITVKKHSNSKK